MPTPARTRRARGPPGATYPEAYDRTRAVVHWSPTAGAAAAPRVHLTRATSRSSTPACPSARLPIPATGPGVPRGCCGEGAQRDRCRRRSPPVMHRACHGTRRPASGACPRPDRWFLRTLTQRRRASRSRRRRAVELDGRLAVVADRECACDGAPPSTARTLNCSAAARIRSENPRGTVGQTPATPPAVITTPTRVSLALHPREHRTSDSPV